MPDELTIPRIQKWMQLYHVSPQMLATALHYSRRHIRDILSGRRRLLPDMHETLLAYFLSRKAEHERRVVIMQDLDRCA